MRFKGICFSFQLQAIEIYKEILTEKQDKEITPQPERRSLMRIDSTFENANEQNSKEFAARFVCMFKAPQLLPLPEQFTSSTKTYPSKKMRTISECG